MLCKINRGPHFGETRHFPQSQEVNALILLGDLLPVEDEALMRANNAMPQYPPRGWKIMTQGAETGHPKVVLAFDDGLGCRMILRELPKPVRTWIPDPSLPDGGSYQMRMPIEVPEAVAKAFVEAGGGVNTDPILEQDRRIAAADARRRRIYELEAQQKHEDALAAGFVLANTAKR